MADLTKMIRDFQTKLAGTSERLAELREARRPHAIGAVGGNKKASQAVAEIEAEEAAVRSEADTLTLALEEAEKRKAEADRLAAAVERQRQVDLAADAAAEMLAVAEEIDAKAREIAQLLARRRELSRIVRQAEVLSDGLPNRFLRREPVDRALIHAGIGEFTTLPRAGGTLRRPLAATDGNLLNDLAAGAKKVAGTITPRTRNAAA